jgi:hypothetical protein
MCVLIAGGVGALRSLVWIAVSGSIPVANSPSPISFSCQLSISYPCPALGPAGATDHHPLLPCSPRYFLS